MNTHLASGARQAALALHALDAGDQQWVLAALGADQQAVVRPLLRELLDIGIPADPTLAEGLCSGAGPQVVATDARDLERISVLLRDEPPRLAAALLPTMDQASRARLLAGFPPVARSAVLAQEASLARASALQAAVLAAARLRLAQPPAVAVPKATTGWRRLALRLQARRSRQ